MTSRPKYFYAHAPGRKYKSKCTVRRDKKCQLLKDHLWNVANRAVLLLKREKGEFFKRHHQLLKDLVWLAGLLHDIGKYKLPFQRYLLGHSLPSDTEQSTTHTPVAIRLLQYIEETKLKSPGALRPLVHVIAGHHGGMRDAFSDGFPAIEDHVVFSIEYDTSDAYKQVLQRFFEDALVERSSVKAFNEALVRVAIEFAKLTPEEQELIIRFGFVFLVTADWWDTGLYFNEAKTGSRRKRIRMLNRLDAKTHRKYLRGHQRSESSKAKQGSAVPWRVNEIVRHRNKYMRQATASARTLKEPCLVSLVAPTGAGKTLMGAKVAYDLADWHGLKRVVYAAPYCSIIHQNADCYREALRKQSKSNRYFLEMHSGANIKEDVDDSFSLEDSDFSADVLFRERMANETWSHPFVASTMVQLAESFLSPRPSRCRKLLNYANTVFIIDEIQSWPWRLRQSLVEMTKFLPELNSFVILMSATHPPLHRMYGEAEPVPLLPRNRIPKVFRRTQVRWDRSYSMSNLANLVNRKGYDLCVVNTRRIAQQLASQIDRCYCLNGLQHPRHQKEVIRDIKQKQSKGQRAALVSTQVIQAGVNLDFYPKALRQKAPLDDIIHTIGRVNRHGTQSPNDVIVNVFDLEGIDPAKANPPDYHAGIAVLSEMLCERDEFDIYDLRLLEDYYERLHIVTMDDGHLVDLRHKQQFRTLESKYKLIEQWMTSVVVYRPGEREFVEKTLQVSKKPRYARRRLQPFTISVSPRLLEWMEPRIRPFFDGQILVYDGDYDPKLGVVYPFEDE